MKKAIKIIMASIFALAMFFSTYQIQKPLNKESQKASTISFNKQTAEAKGLFPIFKPKPKPKPTPKKKKKTKAQLYKDAKKKGIKVKGRNSTYKYSKKLRNLPSKVNKGYSSRDLYKDGKLNTRRYYKKDGKAEVDIHYTNHGNAKKHPKVPHRHDWGYNSKGKWAKKTEWY